MLRMPARHRGHPDRLWALAIRRWAALARLTGKMPAGDGVVAPMAAFENVCETHHCHPHPTRARAQ